MVITYDARPLDPRTRYWGVGVVIDSLVQRLKGKFSFFGLAHRFPGAANENISTWPCIPHMSNFAFEGSTLLKSADAYWGTNHFLPASLRGPSLLTVHDLLLAKYPQDQPHSKFLAWRLGSSIKRAARVIADSKTTADELISKCEGIGRKLEVGLLGFEMPGKTCFAPETCILPEESSPYVVMLGAHRPRKNLELATRALSLLLEQGFWARLLVTGEVHSCFSSALAAAHDFVTPLGTIPKDELFRLLKGALALVFPSVYEGFGFPMLEAMASGCPVIALDTPINREISGGAACLLSAEPSEWSEAIRRLSESASFREEMILAGFDNLRRFSWQATADIYADAFSQLDHVP